MNRQQRIEQRIQKILSPSLCEVVDISSQHAGHLPDSPSETHFEITVHSPKFEGLSKVNCHRMVHNLLKEEFNDGLHAISIVTKAKVI